MVTRCWVRVQHPKVCNREISANGSVVSVFKGSTFNQLRNAAAVYFCVAAGITDIEEVGDLGQSSPCASIARLLGWKNGARGVREILKSYLNNPNIKTGSFINKKTNTLSLRKLKPGTINDP